MHKYCSNCGNELADGVNFCSRCGTKVQNLGQSLDTFSTDTCSDEILFKCSTSGLPGFRSDIVLANTYIKFGKDRIPIDQIKIISFSAVHKVTNFYLSKIAYWQDSMTSGSSGKTFSIPGGTTPKIVIRYGESLEGYSWTFQNMNDYSTFVNLLWQICAKRIITEILEDLRRGEKYYLNADGYSLLNDYGIEMAILKFFSNNEIVNYSWEQIRSLMICKREGHTLRVEFLDRQQFGGNIFTELKLDGPFSPNIFECLIELASKTKVERLSDLLPYFKEEGV